MSQLRDEPGHIVVVVRGGCNIYIPFKNRENAGQLCAVLYQQMKLLRETELKEQGRAKHCHLPVDGGEIDPIAFVLVEEIIGWYVSFGDAHAKAVERLADATEKALDPDRDAKWRDE